MARNGSGKEKAESVHLNSLLLSPYFLPPSSYTVPDTVPDTVQYTLHRRYEARSAGSYTFRLTIYPSPLHSKNKLQSTTAPPPLPLHLLLLLPIRLLGPL